MRAPLLCTFVALAGAAETTVAPPSIGLVQDCQGHVRRVFGAPGAFLLGPPETASSIGVPPLPEGVTVEGRKLIVHRAGRVERISLPETASQLQSIAHGWVAAAPFLVRLTADGAAIYRLPMTGCSEVSK